MPHVSPGEVRPPRFVVTALLLAALPAHASSVNVLSSRAIMEPSGNTPSDKDGCPPVSSNADPEEGTLQAELIVDAAIATPTLYVTDTNDPVPTPAGAWTRDTRDDLTLDEFSPTNGASVASGTRDLDYLDGVVDGQLAAGTWYVYLNVDKVGYDQELLTGCAGQSVTNDREKYTVSLLSGASAVASGSITVAMERTTSINQNDLDWIETWPISTEAPVGGSFCIRTKYRQSSLKSLDYLIAHTYYHADRMRLDSVDVHYYDANGTDPGSVESGIPGVDVAGTAPTGSYYDTVYFSSANIPTTQSTGDYWIGEYCFTVTDTGGSRFIPYFMTQESGTVGTWKTDSGYNGFASEPPEPINPPILSIAGTCDASESALVGGMTTELTETLEVCNDGYGDAADVLVTASLPLDPNVVFVSADTGGAYDAAADTIDWTLGDLAAETCTTLSWTVSVTPDVADTSIDTAAGATVSGVALVDDTYTVSADTTETCPYVVNAYTPSLAVDKVATSYTDTDGSGALSPGDTVHYAVTATNTGNVALTGVQVVDDPDQAYVAALTASGAGAWDGDVVTWTVGDLEIGGSVTYTVSATLVASFPAGTTAVVNVATGTSAEAGAATDTETVSVTAAPALALTKTAAGYTDADGNGALSPGDTVTYTLAWANTGDAPASAVTLADDPDQAWLSGVSATGGAWDGDRITWSLGTVAAGASGTLTYTATLAAAGTFPSGATPVANVATLDCAETAPVTSSASVSVSATASLSLTKTASTWTDRDGDGALSPGDDVTYTLAWSSDGNAPATGATLTDDPDEGHVAAIATTDGLYDGDRVTWTLGDVAPGEAGTVTYTATLGGAGTFLAGTTAVLNSATITSAETGPVTDVAQVTVTASAALALSKVSTGYTDTDGDGVLSPGDAVHWRLTYANGGNADATGVVLADDPDEAGIAAVTDITGGGAYDGDRLSWTVGTLPAGTSASVTYTTVLRGAGTFADGASTVANTATLSGNEDDPAAASASVTVEAAAALTLAKAVTGYTDADGDGVLSPGDTVAYAVTWANAGNAPATATLLTDDPDETALASVDTISDLGAWDGDRITWSFGTVQPGESGTVTYTATLAAAGAFAHGATPVPNDAWLQSAEAGPVGSAASVTVTASAALVASKQRVGHADTDGDGLVSPGDTLTYTVAWSNAGNAPATGVTVADDPDQAWIAGVGTTDGTWDGDRITWSVGTLAPGASGSATYTVTLASAGTFPHGATPVANTLVVTGGEGSATASDTVTVDAAVALAVSKAASGTTDADGDGRLSPGDAVTYVVSWANTGNAAASGATLVDDPDEAWLAGVTTADGAWDGDRIAWTLGTLAPGATGSVTYTATLAADGGFPDGATNVANTATLDSDQSAPATASASVTVTAEADLAVSKVAAGTTDNDGDGALSPGDAVTYAVTWSNPGDAAASAVVLTDDPDEGYVAGVTGLTDGGAYDGDVITWSLGEVAPGATGTYTYTVVLASAGSFPAGTTAVDNVVAVQAGEVAPVGGGATVTVTAAVELALTKTASGYTDTDGDGLVSPGDTVQWTLSYANTGNAPATAAVLTDDPEAAWLAGVAATNGTWDGSTITWSLGTLAPGATGTVTYTATLAGAGTFPHGGTDVGGGAALVSAEGSAVASASIVVTATSSVTLAKAVTGHGDLDGDGAVSPGDTVTYTLSYANTGNAGATGVTVSDDPDQAWLAGVSGTGTWDGDTIAWSLGTLAPGAAGTLTYTVTLAPAGGFPDGGATVGNVATIRSGEGGAATASATVTVTAEAALSVAKAITGHTDTDGDGVVSPGDALTYAITWANAGNAAATGVTVTDDPDQAYVAAVSTADGTWNGDTIAWAPGTLAPGASGSATYTVTLAGAGTFPNGATAVGNTVVVASGEGTATASATATVEAAVALAVSKAVAGTTDTDGDGQLSPGDAVTYTVTWANTGNATATGVTLVDDPDQAWLAGVTSADGTWDGDRLSWTLGSAAPGASGSFTYTATLAAAGTFPDGDTAVDNTATLTAHEAAPVSASAAVTVTAEAALAVAKASTGTTDVDGDGLLSPGDQVTYTVTWANAGDAPASGVTVTDDPDEGYVVALSTADGAYDGDVVTWTIGAAAPGASGSFTYTVTLAGAGGFPAGDTLVDNVVAVTSGETGPVGGGATVTVTAAVELSLAKTSTGYTDADGDGVLSPGDTVQWALTWANTGNAAATGAVLTDDPEAGWLAGVSVTGGTYDGSTIGWSLGTVAPGATGTVTYTTTLAAAGTFPHGGTDVGGGATLVAAEDTATASAAVTVQAAANLTLAKVVSGTTDTDGNGRLSPGDAVTYTLSWANTGNATATGVTLTDDPDQARLAGVSTTGTWDGDRIAWAVGDLAPGASGTVTYTATLAGVGTFADGVTTVANSAAIQSGEVAPVAASADVTVSADAALVASKAATGWIDADADGVLSPGDSVTYAVTWENTGDAAATGVIVTDDPDDAWLASVSSADGLWDGDTLAWDVGTLEPGVAETVTYTVVLAGPGTFPAGATAVDNTVVVAGAEGSSTATQTVTVTASAALAVAKATTGYTDTDGDGVLSPGDTVHYRVDYANTGNAAATGVLLTDSPDLAWLASVSPGTGAWDGAAITWDLGAVASGASGSVSYAVTLLGAGSFPAGTTAVDNVATFSSLEDGPVTDTVTVEVDAAPILVPAKAVAATEAITATISNSVTATSAETATAASSGAASATVTVATRITYTISVANTGTAEATAVVVEDALPAGTTLESATGTWTAAGGVVSWSIASLAPGATETVTVTLVTD